MRQIILATTCIAFTFLIPSISLAQKETAEQLELKDYVFKNNKGTEVKAELGTFHVPENRQNNKSRKIKISFVRFRSTNPNPGSPIIYLAGGPGGSGIESAKGARFDLFMALRQYGDVIALDQRGIGLSNQFPKCTNMKAFPLQQTGSMNDYINLIKENTLNCLEEYKKQNIDINGYTILQNADDIEDLRKQLKADKIILWGISFGTQLAFTYANKYPQHLDNMILAALEAPYENIKYPHQVEDLLDTINNDLKKDPLLAAKYPDLKQLMKNVLNNLEKQPILAKVKDRNNNETSVAIGKLEVQLVTSIILLKNISELKLVPMLYKQMQDGNFSQVANMVMLLRSGATKLSMMGLLTDASTGTDKKRMKQVKKEAATSVLGRTTNFPFPDLNEYLGIKEISSAQRELKRSNIPGLFFSGTHDGRTFLESAEGIIKKFPNAKHVIIHNVGHDMFEASPEVLNVIKLYLEHKTVPAVIILPVVKYL